jgi:hypothetical protein
VGGIFSAPGVRALWKPAPRNFPNAAPRENRNWYDRLTLDLAASRPEWRGNIKRSRHNSNSRQT